jgi:prepilin-type N-terminal cleavage/methylation domain-containing protein
MIGRGFFREPAGFSLIELLVSITIVSLLAGTTAVTVPRALEAGKKAKVKAELASIVTAVKTYRQEYGRYPINASIAETEFNSWYGPPTQVVESRQLMRILGGENLLLGGVEMNPKKIRFLEGPKPDGTFQDAWGNQYCVKMDTNESGAMEYYDPSNNENIKLTVIALSLGKNKTQDDPSLRLTRTCDDVFSWRD